MAGRTVIIRNAGGGGGFGGGSQVGVTCCCGCVRCCSCVNWGYLTSRHGILKVVQCLLSSFCESFAVRYGLGYAQDMGSSFEAFLSACSAALIGSFCLLVCFVFSDKSVGLVRSSLFETLHSGICAFLLLSSSSSLLTAVNLYLWPRYLVTPFFQVYPAMTAAAIMGMVLGGLYALECYLSYRYYKGYR